VARGNNIALLMSGVGKKQVDKDTPLDLADLDTRINVTSRNWVNTDKTIEEILDCVAQEVTGKETTRMIRRLPIEGEFTARIAAVLAAYTWGVAAAPAGATANEVWTIQVDATGGSWTFTLTYDGMTRTATIPVGATAAKLKYLLESMDNIGFGNTTVTLLVDTYTITFVGHRAAAAIPVPVIDDTLVTGGGAAVTYTEVTPGSQRSHNVTELPPTEYQPPYTSFAIAFEDEAGSERLLSGACLDNLRFTGAANNGKVTFAGDIIARDLLPAEGLVIPACVVYRPVRTADCLFTHNAVDYTDILKEFEFSYANNLLTGDTAYTGRSVRPSRLERANRRTRQLTYGLLGGVTTAVYQEAEANPEADVKRADVLRIGTAGDSLDINIPNGLTELNTGGGISFDGESEEAVERFIVTPTKQGVTLPTNVVARVPIAVQMLQT
jgi:hypothetical protein